MNARRQPVAIGELLAGMPLLEARRTKLEQLEQLAQDLGVLLSTSAPRTWRELRRSLWTLIRRARRELRAAERGA